MSEADVRPVPTRGRSSTRGRGGFSRGGPRGGRKHINGTTSDAVTIEESLEDQGELGEMKKKYLNELVMLRELFPDWTDVDLVFALQEADGDVPSTVDKITQGNVSQFAEVKKTKDRARSKVKDDVAAASTSDKHNTGARSGRGRGGLESSRGGRGRASDRGRGGHRGGRGGHATTNGTAKESSSVSVPTTESSAWDATGSVANAQALGDNHANDITKDANENAKSAWANVVTAEATPAAASEGAKSSLLPEDAPKKTWASMLKPTPAPVPVKGVVQQPAPPAELVASGHVLPAAQEPVVAKKEPEPIPPTPAIPEAQPDAVVAEPPLVDEASLMPSNDPLTEENVEHLPDESIPPATLTVASTTGSLDPRHSTPIPAAQAPTSRPTLSGYAASASRLAGTTGRSASFQRRVQEQQEAVVMPGHNAVDRAAVQFGSMGLNGEAGLDVDDEREEPETRQPPQHSPPSQPRTSLPPAPKQAVAAQETALNEAAPTPKQAPGLPPASAQNQQQMQQDPNVGQVLPQEAQINHSYSQFGRYGQPGMQQDSVAQPKPHDPFNHQTQQAHYDQYGAHNQHVQPQHAQSGFGSLSSAQSDYSSYYNSEQSRNSYNQYYGSSYGPQDGRGQVSHGQQDPTVGQQRSTSGFGTGPNDPSFASQAQQQAQSRFGEAPGSGNNTPNPIMGAQQQQSGPNTIQSQHSMHQAQGHQQQGGFSSSAGSGYPYGHPYYNSPYQQAYQNQFGFAHQLGGYGGGYPTKQGNMYGAPHGYGMGSQSSYEQHSSSPANSGAFGQNQQNSMRSASGISSGLGGLDEYGRSSQAGNHQQSSGFGGMNDPFARSASGFGGQGNYGQQSMSSGPDDALKPFGDTKSGASPALGQPGRPGSAANSASGQAQSGLPPPQNHQSSFGGGYPSFPGQGNQYGGLGGLGNHQQNQSGMGGQSAYGSYGSSGFNQAYGGYGGSRGGWGQNYNTH